MAALAVNGFTGVDRAAVIGALQATGSRDPDVLYAARTRLISRFRVAKVVGVVLALGGLGLAAIPSGWLAGGPLVGIGWWVRRWGRKNAAEVEAGYAEFLGLR